MLSFMRAASLESSNDRSSASSQGARPCTHRFAAMRCRIASAAGKGRLLQPAKAQFDVAQAEAEAAAAVLREAEVAWLWIELLAANESFMAAANGAISVFRWLNACADAIKRRGWTSDLQHRCARTGCVRGATRCARRTSVRDR